MQTLAILAGFFLTLSVLPALDFKAVRDAQPSTPGTESWTVQSPYQKSPNKIEVLLPKTMALGKRYPVVYCLPVNAGTTGDWGHPLTEVQKDHLADRYQAIFVTPAYERLPWFGDNPARRDCQQNNYFLQVVLPLIEKNYPVLAEPAGRHLIGFSKSALGALSLFLRNPELFASIAVFENWWGVPNEEQWRKWGFAECYGTRANFDLYDPQNLIKEKAALLANGDTRITVLCGGPDARLGVEGLWSLLLAKKVPHRKIQDLSWGHTWTSGWLPHAVTGLRLPQTNETLTGN